jgi:transposase
VRLPIHRGFIAACFDGGAAGTFGDGAQRCHTIPERCDQRERRAGGPGRPPGFDPVVYRRRNVVERCINRLKQWRGIATRCEKRAVNYRAAVVIAALMIWVAS